MTDDSLTPPPLERLLTALLELPPLPGLASLHEAGDGAAQLVLEVLDTALHTPPAQPQRDCAAGRCRQDTSAYAHDHRA